MVKYDLEEPVQMSKYPRSYIIPEYMHVHRPTDTHIFSKEFKTGMHLTEIHLERKN